MKFNYTLILLTLHVCWCIYDYLGFGSWFLFYIKTTSCLVICITAAANFLHKLIYLTTSARITKVEFTSMDGEDWYFEGITIDITSEKTVVYGFRQVPYGSVFREYLIFMGITISGSGKLQIPVHGIEINSEFINFDPHMR